MNLAQAQELANAFVIPGFLSDDDSLTEERRNNEEAISLLSQAWWAAPAGSEPFSYDLIRKLADRNRNLCDSYGAERLREVGGSSLSRRLSDEDLLRGVAKLQKRSVASVRKSAGPTLADLAIAYTEKPVRGAIMGVDIETTSRYPDRGYIINVGLAFMRLQTETVIESGHTAYFGLPELYKEQGVPLTDIHHISWGDLAGKTAFREDRRAQKLLLRSFKAFPVMAHNAAFEDSWFMLHLEGYAEARKAGKIVLIDSRDICRRIDADARGLPRESAPAALENWARRRGVLAQDEKERHLGLDDVILMLRTAHAEFALRNMLED